MRQPNRRPVPAGAAPTVAPTIVVTPTETAVTASATPASASAPAEISAPDAHSAQGTPDVGGDADVDARVLVAFDGYEPNDIVTAAAADIAVLVLAGKVDDDATAVAYAWSLIA